MRRGRLLALVVPVVVAAGCGGGGGKKEDATPATKTVRGETETGMKLKVETFLAPSADPELAKLDKYRAEVRYAPVAFLRITADNPKGSVPDRGRPVDFARSADAIATGKAIETRFVCDVLQFEWLPKQGSADQTATYRALRRELCSNGPPKPN